MSEDHQLIVPESFIALFVPPGRLRPSESREHILQRYEFCEDMAQMLSETARARLFELGITEQDVLVRIHRGLASGETFSAPEAWWVVHRLAEVLGWDAPDLEAPAGEPPAG
jgi:hypothetical protein